MDQLTMLNAFDNLLEDRTTCDDVINSYEVVVADTRVKLGTHYITLQANVGTIRHFRLTEV